MKLHLNLVISFWICFPQNMYPSGPNDSLLFVRLKMVNKTFTIEYIIPAAGPNPSITERESQFSIEIHSKSGDLLWYAPFDINVPHRLEYEDPITPGKIRTVIDTSQAVYITLRIPYFFESVIIEIFERIFGEKQKGIKRAVLQIPNRKG